MNVKKGKLYMHKKLGTLIECTAVDEPAPPGQPGGDLIQRVAWFRFSAPPIRTPEHVLDFCIPETLWADRIIEMPENSL